MTGLDVAPATAASTDLRRVQRRSLLVLVLTQVIGGVGVAIGIAVGALLAADMGGIAISGFGQSSLVVGAALLALPVTRVMRARGRRPGLALAYAVGAVGAALVVVGAWWDSLALLFVGLFLFGGGSAANYQARYAAVDLAEPSRRGRQLSLVVWATTIGAVAGPNLAPLVDEATHGFGDADELGAVRLQRGRVPARRADRDGAAAPGPAADRARPSRRRPGGAEGWRRDATRAARGRPLARRPARHRRGRGGAPGHGRRHGDDAGAHR